MPQRIVRIAFRGLMVLNYQGEAGRPRFMEIGFLDARTGSTQPGSHVHTPASSAVHIPRVITMENGVLSDVLDLRRPGLGLGTVRRWRLTSVIPGVQQTPLQTEVTLKGPNPPADRQSETDANKEDFGWVIDLENREVHNRDLTREISTARLLMVLTVDRGEFFTKLLSKPLVKQKVGGRTDPFGKVAAVTGLDIKFDVPSDTSEASVQLLAGEDTPITTLETRKDTRVFEISNAPADVFAEEPLPTNAPGHFHMYYEKLFIQSPPNEQFDFKAVGGSPGPDPALCGVSYLGQRGDDL